MLDSSKLNLTHPNPFINTEQVKNEDEDLKQLMRRVSGGDVDKYISDLKSGYRQTKCVAELLVRRARKLGLRVNVFRCGMIVGETGKLASPERTRQGGVANESDWVSRLLGGIAHMRSYPACKGILTTSPLLDMSTLTNNFNK